MGGLGVGAVLVLFAHQCTLIAYDTSSIRAHPVLRLTTEHETAMSCRRNVKLLLSLRGGWDEDDDDSEYEDWSDEDEDEFEEEPSEEAERQSPSVHNPENTWAAHKTDGQIEGLVRAGEGLTREEIMDHPLLVPLGGGWDGGHNKDVERKSNRHWEESRARGRMWEDSVPPLRLADVYGLGNWTYLQGELDEPEFTEETLSFSRSILKVPPEELPDLFHFPMGNNPFGRVMDPLTLAIRFSNWTGPLPSVWQAYVYTPRGRIYVNSFSKDIVLNETELTDELGGEKECCAFFVDATEQLVQAESRWTQLDGTFEPGPACIGFDVMVGAAEDVCPTLPSDQTLEDRIVPDNHAYVFQAVRARREGERVLCREGRRCWAESSHQYPRWAIDVGWQEDCKSFHLAGEGSGLASDFKTDDRDTEEGGGPVTELSGQWVFSNETFGSVTRCRLDYQTSMVQFVFQVHSGPWVFQDCDITCAHGICVQVSYGALVFLEQCRVGGTGPDHTVHKGEPGHAKYGVDVEGDGNVTMSNVLLRDIGLHGGAGLHVMHTACARASDSVFRGCRVALQLGHFPDVGLTRCVVEDVIDAAFWSESYRMVPPRFQAEYEELEAIEEWAIDHTGRSRSSLRDDPRNFGALGSEDDRGLDGDCREGRLVLRECRVESPVWLTQNRPFTLHSDAPELT